MSFQFQITGAFSVYYNSDNEQGSGLEEISDAEKICRISLENKISRYVLSQASEYAEAVFANIQKDSPIAPLRNQNGQIIITATKIAELTTLSNALQKITATVQQHLKDPEYVGDEFGAAICEVLDTYAVKMNIRVENLKDEIWRENKPAIKQILNGLLENQQTVVVDLMLEYV